MASEIERYQPRGALVDPVAYRILSAETKVEELRVSVREAVGMGITSFDLERVKIPAGGAQAWEISIGSERKYVPEFGGVIIKVKQARAYWSEKFGGGGRPPDCSSIDAAVGVGDPGGDCLRCPLSQFGSAIRPDGTRGRGQACKQMLMVFMLRPGRRLPMIVVLPPTSIKPARKFFTQLWDQEISPFSIETTWRLSQQTSKDGIKYSIAEPRAGLSLSKEQYERVVAYSEEFRPIFERERVKAGDYEENNGGPESDADDQAKG